MSAEKTVQLAINTIRSLAIDAIQKANSGHPGTPLDAAPTAYTLWQQVLRYDPDHPNWLNRDRFVLSGGHASMLLYALIHLTGIKASNPSYEKLGREAVSLDDIKNFRQAGSRCPGHPEYGWTTGVESTTGPLGQGLATSVGMAIASRWLAETYNRPGYDLFDFNVYSICGDGDMMEGISSEAASVAAHLRLSNLCWIYDNNRVTIEGHTDITFTEDVAARFLAYGWEVIRVTDPNDIDKLERAYRRFLTIGDRPTLIVVHSHIGYGAPHKQDSPSAHGEPLGPEEVRLTKEFFGFSPDETFVVPPGVREHFAATLGARGSYQLQGGHRFNAHKIVLDPYAKSIARDLRWDDALYGYPHGTSNEADLDERDSAPFAPLACVIEPEFSWGEDRAPRTPWHETVVYEVHVKGFTRHHPLIPESVRGTYAGLASSAAIHHLRDLGVTAVELMPIHYHIDDRFLVESGRTNFWGYNTLGFFAPDPRYAATGPKMAVQEFKSMVRTLHSAGIEVILDVVYNHTAEGNHLGPTLSMRGIDNAAYYRLAGDGGHYVDFTGCGNSLNVSHRCALKLIMDSLRYWVLEMHVDGFRFDLCSALARQLFEVDRLPMLLAGDELGHTQLGNNNAYCQDSTLTWLNWDLAPDQRELLEFVRGLIKLRTQNPVFRRRHFFQGRPIHGLDVKDLYWLTSAGTEMSDQDWNTGSARCLGMGLLGNQIDEADPQGERIVGDSFLILLNSDYECVSFRLSGRARDQNWELVFDTSSPNMTRRLLGRLAEYPLQDRSVAVLRPA